MPNGTIIEGDIFEVIPKLMPDLKGNIDLVLTSPPYNQGKEYDLDLSEDKYIEWTKEWMSLIPPLLKPTGVFVLNIGEKVTNIERSTRLPEIWLYAVKNLGLHYIEMYIWNKSKHLPVKSRFRASSVYEPCLWFSKSLDFSFHADEVRRPYKAISKRRMDYKIKRRWARERDTQYPEYKEWSPNPKGALPKNILDIGSESSNRGHPAVYPTGLAEWFIKAATVEGDMVLDPFLGSGTTMVSALQLGRSCIGIELEQVFTSMSKARVLSEVNVNVPIIQL